MEWCLQCKDNWNRYRTLNIHFYSTSVRKMHFKPEKYPYWQIKRFISHKNRQVLVNKSRLNLTTAFVRYN